MEKRKTQQLVYAALFLALGVLFPQIFHVFGAGSVFLPMHIPVILSGFIVGSAYGGAVGVLSVVLSSAIFSMPGFTPNGFSMIFELAAYGFFSGYFFNKLFVSKPYIKRVFFSLIAAMLVGRVIGIVAKYIIFTAFSGKFAIVAVLTGLFVSALPGIALQLVSIPAIMIGLRNSKLIKK